MAPLRLTLPLVVANLLIPVAILVFASGFFPYKPFLPGLAEYEELDVGLHPGAPFNKVIFMVVDALRSDFVYSAQSGFAFTQSLISDGAAMPFTAHATSPTITMPRIKAITTGSIPSFLDVILNFAESDTSSTLATQDTWLAQMKLKGTGKMVMYGDDTWLKLFPETFDRADGTSSFFVADFTEVDQNVTRHVPEELTNDDWNTMVLHYLGLDHIGHKTGPRGPNMISKQREMDGIVKKIYTAIQNYPALEDTLLVLCGDHGMNDAGNHGGSAPGETSPALVFISPTLKVINPGRESPLETQDDFQYYTTVEQSDIAPTLAGLLDFPVPRNNLGAFITEFLPFWTGKIEKVQLLLRNARQILNIVTATFSTSLFENHGEVVDCSGLSTGIEKLGCDWKAISRQLDDLKQDPEVDVEPILLALAKVWAKDAQEIMSSTVSNYDMTKLVTGQVMATVAVAFAIAAASPTIFGSFASITPFLLLTMAYGAMMFASSYVEEEHHFWYWAASGWLVLLSFKRSSRNLQNSNVLALGAYGVLAGLRVLRRWNQTGQKLAGEPDIARSFLAKNNELLWILIGLAYSWNTFSLARSGFPRLSRSASIAVASVLLVASISFKLAFTHEDAPEQLGSFAKAALALTPRGDLVTKASVVFLVIGMAAAYTVSCELFQHPKPGFRNQSLLTLHSLLFFFLATQSRATNIPILLLSTFQLSLLRNLNLSMIEITTTTLLLQHASFFAAGGSNAISSIDLSSAYNGVSGYNVAAVGLLTFLSNWVGPVFWTSGANMLLLQLAGRKNTRKFTFHQHLSLLTLFTTTSLAFVMAACTVLRTHLFIWTVFSPKYLYSMVWAFGQHLLMNVGFGSLLYWIGSR